MDKRIHPITARFASKETETAYQAFIFEGDWRNNIYVMASGFIIYGLYAVLDASTLVEWRAAALVRLSAVLSCFSLLFVARTEKFRRFRETAPLVTVVILGVNLNAIIFLYTNLEDAYYVGLVQECVFVCFLMRMSFAKTILALSSFVSLFAIVAIAKIGYTEFSVQIVVMLTMATVCGIGSYLLQKFRRFDFQKTLIIDQQNKQLRRLLSDAKKDNQRKVAALNMLVHFVKTPLHQITGFSDIVMNSLTSDNDRHGSEACVESAQYIKDATANLARSVNSLLIYHRLDEVESRKEERASIENAITDLGELIGGEIKVETEGSIGEIKTYDYALKTAMQCLADYYNAAAEGVTTIALSLSRHEDCALLALCDNGRPISASRFEEETKPLTKIENYLSGQGSDMPMALRTVARAAEVCGGEFRYEELPDGNMFTLTFQDSTSQINAPISAVA